MLKKILNYILGKPCPECGKRHLDYNQAWIRGWNELCNQASGASGWRCQDCGYIVWDVPYEEWIKYQPDWITPYHSRNNIRKRK